MRLSLGAWSARLAGLAAALLAVLAVAVLPTPLSHAVVTFDLIHDSPEMRQVLKGELEKLEAPSGEVTEGVRKPQLVEELERIWFEREKFLQIGEKDKAARQMELLWEREMEKGIRNLPEYGEVLVREARRNIERGQLEDAESVLSLAQRLSPEFLPVYFAQASLVLKKGVFNFLGAGRELVKGFAAVRRSFRLQVWAVTNGLVLVNAALALFFAIFILLLTLRYGGRVSHDFAEILPVRFSATARKIVGLMALFLPLLLGLPVWWWFILTGFALIPYVGRFPRIVLFAGLLFLATFPLQNRIFSSLLSMHRQPLLERIVTVREDHWGDADYQALYQLSVQGEPSPLALGTLGLAAKRLGRFEEAGEAYRAALELDPGNAGLLNNLGNLSLIADNADQAIATYERAIGLDQGLFAPHYNLGIAYRTEFELDKGGDSSARAVAIDPAANAYYTSISGEHFNRETVDELPSLKQIWTLALQENKWQEATADHLWMSRGLVVPRAIWLYALGALLFLSVAVWALRAARGPARSCSRCGRAFCSRCSVKGRDICSQCHSIFVRKEGVEAKVRVRKMAEIKRRQQLNTFRRTLLAVLLPGGGHCSAGHYVVGTLFLLPAAFFLATRFLVADALYPAVWHLELTTGWGLTALAWGLYVLWWAVSLLTSLRLED